MKVYSVVFLIKVCISFVCLNDGCVYSPPEMQVPSNVSVKVGDVASMTCTLITGNNCSNVLIAVWRQGNKSFYPPGNGRFSLLNSTSYYDFKTTLVLRDVMKTDSKEGFECVVSIITGPPQSAFVFLIIEDDGPDSINIVFIVIAISAVLIITLVVSIVVCLYWPQLQYVFRRNCGLYKLKNRGEKEYDTFVYFDDDHESHAELLLEELTTLGYRVVDGNGIPGHLLLAGLTDMIVKSSSIILICSHNNALFTSVVGKALETMSADKIICIKTAAYTGSNIQEFMNLNYITWPYDETCDKFRKRKQFLYRLKLSLPDPTHVQEVFDLSEKSAFLDTTDGKNEFTDKNSLSPLT